MECGLGVSNLMLRLILVIVYIQTNLNTYPSSELLIAYIIAFFGGDLLLHMFVQQRLEKLKVLWFLFLFFKLRCFISKEESLEIEGASK